MFTDWKPQKPRVPSNPINKMMEDFVHNGAMTEIAGQLSRLERFARDVSAQLIPGGRIEAIVSSATPTPDADTTDIYIITAQAEAAAFGAPTGSPTAEQKLVIRIKDNGGAQALSFNAIYRSSTVTLPTTTVASATLRLGFFYNSVDSKWDLVAKA